MQISLSRIMFVAKNAFFIDFQATFCLKFRKNT